METAPLTRNEMNIALEEMRKKIAEQFGVSLVEDVNGWTSRGAGSIGMTLRFSVWHDVLNQNRSYSATFTLNELSCYEEDVEQDRLTHEDK